MTKAQLQWGGRFSRPPDAALIAFGSSLEEDLVLTPFDVRCSIAHVAALEGGGVVGAAIAGALRDALHRIESEIAQGTFEPWARASGAEDIHGAIDARVRELCPNGEGEFLHAGRSRNDQVATTLALYARDRAARGAGIARQIAAALLARAKEELNAQTAIAATTHWQPAQPVLLAFWIVAGAELFVRAVRRFTSAGEEASRSCALGSAAVAGTTLPLDRAAAARELGFAGPSRNAMDAIGTRDAALDVAHAYARAIADASRVAGEIVLWCTPAIGYARLGDASSTGSSLMPQKRNPDPFELVRANAAEVCGAYASAVVTLQGLPLSYHRDLQVCKALAIAAIESGEAVLRAFARSLDDVQFDREAMNARASEGYTVATDVADALVLAGISARRAHDLVGAAVAAAEDERRPLRAEDLDALASRASIEPFDAPLDAAASIRAKRTVGSTNPSEVEAAIVAIERELT
ncbi:MAG: argininosuccinate lyase [Candidatus Tyrphobacter sp.]